MHVVLVQLDVAWEAKEANFERVGALLAASPPHPGALVVLPEMFAVGFSMNVARIHEGKDRPTERFLAQLARRYQATVVGGLVTQGADGRGRNEAVVVAPDGTAVARYAKLHPFGYAGESEHYSAGDAVVTFDWQGFVVAPFICYDLRFPEAYRAAVVRGANVLVTIANFPRARVHHWTSLLVARAIENQAYAVGVNRCGDDPNGAYPGRSLVVDPLGEIVVDGGAQEGIVSAALSLQTVTAYRARFPVLADLRPDLLGPGGRLAKDVKTSLHAHEEGEPSPAKTI